MKEVLVMHRLAGILFQMQAGDTDLADLPAFQLDIDDAAAHDGVGKLADLVALRQIRVEVVLAVETADEIDLGVQP
jgi:hypothetical protein